MELNTTTSHATSEAKVTSAYWGYRELTADEICAVAGGDIGDYADGGDRGYGGGDSSASSGSASCESPAAAAARAAGYEKCDALGFAAQAAAQFSTISAAKELAAQVGPVCKLGIDNVVDAVYRTSNYEFCNASAGGGVFASFSGGGDHSDAR